MSEEEKQEKIAELLRLSKSEKTVNDEIDVILYEEESMIRDYQAIMKTWFPVGHQRMIPTYGVTV